MGATTIQHDVTLVVETCCNCGVPFAMPLYMQKKRLEDHVDFYCPNGHGQHFTGPTEEQKRIAKLEQDKKTLEQRVEYWKGEEARQSERAERQKRKVAAAKGQLTKIKNRVGHGVCPCCNRTFQNLARHMAGKHPDWSPETVVNDATPTTADVEELCASSGAEAKERA